MHNYRSVNIDAIVKKCDELYEAGNIFEAYECITEAKDHPSTEVQWRVARSDFKLAERNCEPSEMKRAISEGLERLNAALKVAPKCANTHKWIAILLASKEEHESFKQRIEEAVIIREHLLKAAEYNPNDSYTRFALGKWCFMVASMPWVQKKLASTLFPNPPTSSYEQALVHFKEAEKLNPNIFTTCFLMQAICLLELGDKAQAGYYLSKCVSQQDKDELSKTNAKLASQLAKKHDLGEINCGNDKNIS